VERIDIRFAYIMIIPKAFKEYVKKQEESAKRHQGRILETDGYLVGMDKIKFFALEYSDGMGVYGDVKVIAIPMNKLRNYEIIAHTESMMPTVRLKCKN
jgi:hypothetical protein